MPNFSTVRCAYIDASKGRLYTGGSGEFGYYEEQTSGSPQYVSLVDKLSAKERDFAEIWGIHNDGSGNLWFQGDFKMFRYDGKKCTCIPAPDKIVASVADTESGRLFVALQSGSLYTMSGNRLLPLGGCGILQGTQIKSLIPRPEGRLLIATAFNGLFLFDGTQTLSFPTVVDSFLKENQLFCAAASGDEIAFGTVTMGAVLLNMKTGARSYINRATGLQNNTVLGVGFDFANALWLCLDNGVSVAFTHSPVRNLFGSANDYGAGYVSFPLGNRMLLGTNQALYSMPFPLEASPLPPVPEKIMNGQVWSTTRIGNTLFIGSDTGLYTCSAQDAIPVLRKVEGVPGTWCVRQLPSNPKLAIASTYNKFFLLQHTPDGWISTGNFSGFSDTGGKFEIDSKGDIWIAHWLKGVYRAHPDIAKRRFNTVQLFTSRNGLPTDRNNWVTRYRGHIVICTEGGIFRPTANGGLQKDIEATKLGPVTIPSHIYDLPDNHTISISADHFWFTGRNGKGELTIDSISYRSVSQRLIPGFENITPLGDSQLIISNQEGFFCVDPAGAPASRWKAPVFVSAVYAAQDSLIYRASIRGSQPTVELSYDLNSLKFEFAMPEFFDEKGVLYSCMLEKYDNGWSTPSTASSKEYTRLHEGEYTLRVRAFDTTTGLTSETSMKFTVLPPWYRSTVAYICYILLMGATIYFVFRFVRKASMKAAHNIELKKEEELAKVKEQADKEALRKDYEIAALKSEQLETDIKHKSSELGNITMNVIRKNEILLDISSRLKKMQENNGDQPSRDIERIQTIIRENISHDDDWKNFNQNFDIVYENYTKRLMEKHPDLNKNEQRICCYLKMGLSSKEIAPLFNISPRSVEMSRYRLRKKLNLPRETNLTTYLQTL